MNEWIQGNVFAFGFTRISPLLNATAFFKVGPDFLDGAYFCTPEIHSKIHRHFQGISLGKFENVRTSFFLTKYGFPETFWVI